MTKKIKTAAANQTTGHAAGCPCCSGERFEMYRTFDAGLDSAAYLGAGALEAAGGALPFRLDDYAGLATYRGKPIFTQEQIIDQIDAGREIEGKTISFGFLDKDHTLGVYNNKNFGFTMPDGYTPFSEAQKEVAREGMALWDDLIAPSVIEKKGSNGADILFANTTTGPAQAGAYYPGNGQKYQGDVWVATPEKNWTNDWLGYNGYGRTTLIHEAGHALGLSHPGAYNFGPGFAVNYTNGAEYAQDSEQFSIMSYWSPQETGTQPVDVRLGLIGNAQTPLIHDILTIQAKYGADPTTRADDTVYFSNSTADRAVYDLDVNPFPYLAVYDAGGEDTFDFSDANMSVFIDLRPDSFSSATIGSPTLAAANAATEAFNAATDEIQGDFELWTSQAELDGYAAFIGSLGQSRIFNDTGVAGINATSHGNISIAYNTIIENAIGGAGRDYLVGNHVSNELSGNGGNDVINGLGGNDAITGGAGNDEFRFTNTGDLDAILDFTSGKDWINLSEIDANANAAGNQAFAAIGSAAFSGVAGQLRIYSEGGSTFAAGDVNGDGQADFVIDFRGADVLASDFLF